MAAKEALQRIYQPDPAIDDELRALGDEDSPEMTNLPASRTGIKGILFISTAMGSHGPRVKFFEKTGKGQPSFSVSISETPVVLASSLPDRAVRASLDAVIAWVALNRVELLRFWEDGSSWTIDELTAFVENLKKLT